MTEAQDMARIMLGVGAHPLVRLFRNTVGEGWQAGSVIRGPGLVRLEPGDVALRNARAVTFGLPPGSSDLIGWRLTEITPAMVGLVLPVWASLEIKTATGRATAKQTHWIDVLARHGAYAGIARGVDDAKTVLRIT